MQLETMIIVIVIMALFLLIIYLICKLIILTNLKKFLANNPDDEIVLQELKKFESLDTFTIFPGIYAGARKILEENQRTEIITELNRILEIKPKKPKISNGLH